MKIEITTEQVTAYTSLLNDGNSIHQKDIPVIPGNLLVHYIIHSLELPLLKSNQSTFKKPVLVGEDIALDYHQTGNIIEYRITSGRELKLTGTLELIGG
ncbi:hypothetical protein [Macrococcus equipercicus]|uniref:Uncharacterized protein n=1 Tax=Macrococcus equipercicus TaxID=69967 RepID=A0A9Q9BMP4_9STAP|nr:hypothetical protein [Macrococcus equipercicus]KAA1039624.1 hypothetical protein ERX35_005995 [Macrococcus equipercicus]UTH13955.1 hypothetical protein KFV11_00855 [Macrococcus equipercicus]